VSVCSRHLKNASIDFENIHYEFSEDGTLKDTEIVIMNRHKSEWKEVRTLYLFCKFCEVHVSRLLLDVFAYLSRYRNCT